MSTEVTAIRDDTVRVIVEPNNVLRRWPCVVCGGVTEKEDWLAIALNKDGPRAASHHHNTPIGGNVGVVCEECLAAGPDAAGERLRQYADGLEADARKLRALAEREWVWPTADEWECFREAWVEFNGGPPESEAERLPWVQWEPPLYPGSEEWTAERERQRRDVEERSSAYGDGKCPF